MGVGSDKVVFIRFVPACYHCHVSRNLMDSCLRVLPFPSLSNHAILLFRTMYETRVLREYVMVRIGGGWDTLGNFLSKLDPCRAQVCPSSQLTNLETVEIFLFPCCTVICFLCCLQTHAMEKALASAGRPTVTVVPQASSARYDQAWSLDLAPL
jgi:hypothetical protein